MTLYLESWKMMCESCRYHTDGEGVVSDEDCFFGKFKWSGQLATEETCPRLKFLKVAEPTDYLGGNADYDFYKVKK